MSACAIARKLATGGTDILDANLLARLKGLCRESPSAVPAVYSAIFSQLRKPQAQIRFSCVQLINVLFCRSLEFRKNLLLNGHEYLQLVGCLEQFELWPQEWADRTRSLAISVFSEWFAKFNSAHPQLISFQAIINSRTEEQLGQQVNVEPSDISRNAHKVFYC